MAWVMRHKTKPSAGITRSQRSRYCGGQPDTMMSGKVNMGGYATGNALAHAGLLAVQI